MKNSDNLDAKQLIEVPLRTSPFVTAQHNFQLESSVVTKRFCQV